MSVPNSDQSTPWHLWVVGVVFLLWNGLATFDYIMTVFRYEPYLAGHPEEFLEYFFNAPVWMYVVWAISIIGGLLSALLLLMRRRAAVTACAIAWVASVVAVGYTIVRPVPGGGNVLFGVIVLLIALLVLVYFYSLQRRGVLH